MGYNSRAFEARHARRRNAEVNLATFETADQAGASILDETHLDAGMTAAVRGEKIGQQILYHLWWSRQP